MSEKIYKYVSVTQICTDCQKKIYRKNQLLEVPVDFKISDLKKQITPPENHCPNCKKQVDAKFSFYHEEQLSNE